jgi:hypothetical protein
LQKFGANSKEISSSSITIHLRMFIHVCIYTCPNSQSAAAAAAATAAAAAVWNPHNENEK